MTPDEYKTVIEKLGLSQERAGHLLGLSGRQGRRFATGEARVHPCAALILRLLINGRITFADLD